MLALLLVALSPRISAAQPAEVAPRTLPPSLEVQLDYAASEPPSRLLELLATRLMAELRLAGFAVTLRPAEPAPAPPTTTGDYARISLVAEGDRITLEISSRSLGASSHALLVGKESELGPLALQATEFLRAGLTPRVEPAVSVTPPPRPSAAEAAPLEPVRRGRWLLDMGAATLTNWRAADHLELLSIGAGYAGADRLSLRAGLDVPLTSASFETSRGNADYRLWLAALRADYAWLRWRTGQATLGLDVGAAKVTTSGIPDAPIESRNPALWALSLGAAAAAQFDLSQLVALRTGVRVLTLSPNPLVAILEDERRLGSPSILLELGLRIGGLHGR